jgi:hypothetical protein
MSLTNKIIADSKFSKLTSSFDTYFSHEKNYHLTVEDLDYDWNWESLMNVVNEISKEFTINIHCFPTQGFNSTIKEGNYRRGYGESPEPIKAVYKSVVEFLQWYAGRTA